MACRVGVKIVGMMLLHFVVRNVRLSLRNDLSVPFAQGCTLVKVEGWGVRRGEERRGEGEGES